MLGSILDSPCTKRFLIALYRSQPVVVLFLPMTSAILGTALVATWLVASASVASGQDSSRHIYVAPGEQSGGAPGKTQVYEAGAGFERLLGAGIGVRVEGAALTYFDA